MAKTSILAVCFCLLMGIFCQPSSGQFFNAGSSDEDPWPEVAFEEFEADIFFGDWEFDGFSGVHDLCYEVMIDRCLWRYELGEDYADPYELRIRAASANGLLTDQLDFGGEDLTVSYQTNDFVDGNGVPIPVDFAGIVEAFITMDSLWGGNHFAHCQYISIRELFVVSPAFGSFVSGMKDYRSWMPDGSQRINEDENFRASFDYDNTGAPLGEDNVELVVRVIKPDGTDGAVLTQRQLEPMTLGREAMEYLVLNSKTDVQMDGITFKIVAYLRYSDLGDDSAWGRKEFTLYQYAYQMH